MKYTPIKNRLKRKHNTGFKIPDFGVATVLDYAKVSFLCSMVLGFFYIFSYSMYESVPFPLAIDQFPTTLVVIFIFSCIMILAFGALLVSPILVKIDPINSHYPELYTFEGSATVQSIKIVSTYFLLTGFPVFAIFLILIFKDNLPRHALTCFIFLSFLYILIYLVIRRKHKIFQKYITVIFLNTTSIFWCFLFIFILYSVLFSNTDLRKMESNIIMIVGFLLLITTHFLYVVPLKTKNLSNLHIILSVVAVLISISVYPRTSSYICKKALYALKAGGGVRLQYYFESNMKNKLPKELLKNNTTSIPLFLIYKTKSTDYVRISNKNKLPLYAISKQKVILQKYISKDYKMTK